MGDNDSHWKDDPVQLMIHGPFLIPPKYVAILYLLTLLLLIYDV